jgi:PAS domain S-box-containing protein
MNILIVDDQPTDLKLLRAQLEAEGYVVFEAHDGVDALALLERQRVDAVISDVLMPRMDGYRLCHEIRKHPRLRDLPIIIYTATYTSPGDEKLALDMGADKYLMKPLPVEILSAALHEVIAQPHAALRADALREGEVLKEYNERLVSKLKEKNIALKQANIERRASEERFRQLAEHLNEVFWMTDVAKNEMLYISPAYEAIWGLTCASLYASPRNWLDAIHPEDRERIVQSAFTNQATGTYDEEYRIVRPDGAIRWIHDRAFPVRNQTSKVYRIAGVAQDITERKRAELEIHRQAAFARFNPNPVLEFSAAGEIDYFNAAAVEMARTAGREHPTQILPLNIAAIVRECLDTNKPRLHLETQIGQRVISWSFFPVKLNHAVHCYAGDITERKQAEATLRQSEKHFRSLFESLLNGYVYCRMIFVGDRAEDFTYLSVNRAFETLTGLKDVEGKNVSTVIPGLRDSDPELLEVFGRVARTGVPERFENYMKALGMWFSISVYSPQTEHFVAVFDVITDQKQAEQTLRASEERYRILAETAQDIIYVIDREFRMTYINEYGARQFGRSLPELIGRHLTELFPPETTQWQLADMADVFRTGELLYQERQLSTGPRLMWLDSRLVPIKNATGEVESILGISRDITEHKQVEGQRLRTQRLESIGTLAGGVAHDLNNALAPILLATEMLRLEFPDTAAAYLDLIQAGAQRGAAMVKQLLTFAKGVEGERLLIQPKHLLQEMEKLIGSTFPKNIQLKTRYAKDLWTILGDATQFHQVLLNLCINARDAMPEGGTLTLEAENMDLETIYADALMEAKPGHYVVWRVMDTGTGIPPEILDRIFDPFFTTKGPGKGTGLGLSTLIGIVKSHGGFVRVYSVPGKGSTFAVYLPATASSADNTALPTETDMPYRGHGETILVVDDEAAVRNVLRAVLTKLNFKVLTASDGTDALAQVMEHLAELRAVITDLHMPHMDGLSFVRVLKGRLPQVGIIVSSGRLDEPDENEFKKLGVSALLDKPFSQKELLEALKTVFQK